MELETFTITTAVNATPTNQYVILACAAVVFGGFIFGVMLSHRLAKYSFYAAAAALICSAMIGFGIGAGIKYYYEQTNPNAFTSHITCHYGMTGEKPGTVVEHTTLVKRNSAVACASVGTKVIRLKSESVTMFVQEFETPN